MTLAYLSNLFESVRSGRRGGSVVLLGIDGSGKSTHASELESWFKDRGYLCTLVPFHRYLIVGRLSRRPKDSDTLLGMRRGGHPLRPLLSAIDNLLMYVASSFGRGIEGRVIVYDRFSWSTYLKYKALGYPVGGLKWIFFLPAPTCAILLDVPVRRSLDVIASRTDHVRYVETVLAEERDAYLAIARSRGFAVIDASGDRAEVQEQIENRLGRVFPVVRTRH
jgi:thymidylate kinase